MRWTTKGGCASTLWCSSTASGFPTARSTTGGLWLSEDQGESWRNLSVHLPPIYRVRFAL